MLQALQLEGLKQRGEPRLVHPATLAPSHLCAGHASEVCRRITVCLKHPKKELLQVDTSELKPVAEPWSVEKIDEWNGGVLADGVGGGIDLHGS